MAVVSPHVLLTGVQTGPLDLLATVLLAATAAFYLTAVRRVAAVASTRAG